MGTLVYFPCFCFPMKIVSPDWKPVVTLPNPDIPDSVILELHRQSLEDSLSMEDAATNIRGSLVPDGHSPYPFRRNNHPT